MKFHVASTLASKINDRSVVELKGIAELPLHMDLTYIQTQSLPQIFPIAGLHVTVDHQELTKVEEHFLMRAFDKHKFPLHLSKMGSSFYAILDWDAGTYFMDLLQKSLECTSWNTDAYQAHFKQMNSSHSHFSLRWIGSSSCPLIYQQTDKTIPTKLTISSTINPKYGYHSNLGLHGDFDEVLVFGLLRRDFFIDPYEIQRIDFSPFHVNVVGSVDLEAPVTSPKAALHAFIVKGVVQNTR
jgi:hypothetical protein